MSEQEAFKIAVDHHRAGRLAEAEALYRQLLDRQPAHPDGLHLLGLIALQGGRHQEAADFIRRAIDANPLEAAYYSNLGVALTALDRCEEAISGLRRAIALKPDFAHAHYNLGKAFRAKGEFNEALAAYRAAVHFQPDLALAHNNIGVILHDRRLMDEAAAAYRRAIEFAPEFAEAHGNLANALKDRGMLDEAVVEYRRALELQPQNAAIGSNFIHALQYSPERHGAELAAELQAWNQRHAVPLRAAWRAHENRSDAERQLRVGYVSADFRYHAVGRTFVSTFEAHDRAQFEIVCYSAYAAVDEIGERFRRGADLWREIGTFSDGALADQIREDRIDILIDMSLHTAGNRLLVFARKPAPVQIAWLGYPGTTGLETMDYRITDLVLEPPGMDIVRGAEEPLRLPDAWCCYGAPATSPEVTPLPSGRAGHITFGSFNNVAKINERVLILWAEILRRNEGSRLLLLSTEDRQPEVAKLFHQHGIDAARIEFLAYYPSPDSPRGGRSDEFLRRYGRIDIALDPFPYNGLTTTCDALWMGVPVVALIGEFPLARLSFSVLSNLRLAELSAKSEEEYVEIATALARDLSRLAGLRATLRARMKASPLLDAARFTRNLEAAYRGVWRQWCAGQAAP
ncbi:MAG: tetratricopeptide repeat protein [Chthoniobacteraceae bacterium]